MIWYALCFVAVLAGCVIAAALYLYLERPLPALLFLAKRVGKIASTLSLFQSALGRTQTRLLTAAQAKGWICGNDEDFARLQKRQVNLWLFDAARQMAKQKKRGVPTIFEKQPPTNQTGNNL